MIDVSQRLQQWIHEATEPDHPHYKDADLDFQVRKYAEIVPLLRKLREDTQNFSTEDVITLIGALNSGARQKNNIVKNNSLPELRTALLSMLDGSGSASDKIAEAQQRIKYAGSSILGELYGWAHIDETPLSNECATDALRHLGYDFPTGDYNAFVAAHEQFKQVYTAEVGRLREDIPLNLEIDKLYNVIDKVDLKIRENNGLPNSLSELAPPLKNIFSNRETAHLIFDFFRDGLAQAGCTGPQDERFAVTMPKGRELLRINYGNLYFLSYFRSYGSFGECIGIPLDLSLISLDGPHEDWGKLNLSPRPDVDSRIHMVALPLAALSTPNTDLDRAFQSACEAYHHTYGHWKACVFRWAHRQIVMDAIYDLEARERLFAGKGSSPMPPTARFFSEETFLLLKDLYHTPTAAFYHDHKEAFQEFLERPFKELVAQVADRLPPAITEIMETRKRVVARILKNDFGQGGAWPHYWGAFYPKGSKRAKDAQLSIFMDRSFMEFGFYIGEYGSAQRQRLQTNCETHYEALCDLLAGQFEQAPFLFGDKETYVLQSDGSVAQQLTYSATWRDFLRDPSQFNSDVSLVLSKDALLETSRDELVETAVRAHKLVFPLILLAVSDDPLPAIVDYLGLEDEGEDVDDGEDAIVPVIPYTRADFLTATHLTPTHADEIWDLLHDKQQVIFYGPPGTGKSYVAQHLARWLTDQKEPSPDQMEMIQFHPAYSYEDFIEGIRPVSKPAGEGRYVVDYPAQAGVFRRFCERAARNPDKPHVFIIDEINRGNIPRIFGELMLLLEYRNQSVALPYSGARFIIPENVYLIATMNTADRSIALVDFALRRRFHFIHFGADADLFGRWLAAHPIDIPYLAELYRRLSRDAIDDENFAIGPSYFMDANLTEARLARIWRYSIEPYLAEYYVGQPSKSDAWGWDGTHVKDVRGNQ